MELFKRIFVPDGGYKRVFSIIRFLVLLIGAATASIYFLTDYNDFAAIGFAFTAFVLFRYGQIKGYLK